MAINIASLVKDALTTVGTAITGGTQTVTYKHTTDGGEYNAVTGTRSKTQTTYNISAVFTGFKEAEIDRVNIQATDMKLLIAYSDLPVSPTRDDNITIAGENWTLVQAKKDPTQAALHILQIRKATS